MVLGKRQTLTLELPDDLPDAWADSERVTQIITNLVNNALKYTPEAGTIRVSVRVIQPLDPLPPNMPSEGRLPALLVTVSDSGTGIDLDDQTVLFTRFHQIGR